MGLRTIFAIVSAITCGRSATAASTSTSTSALRASSRSIPVYEDTQQPDLAGSNYYFCSTVNTTAFVAAILDVSNDCTKKASYDWTGQFLPTSSERRELCKCTGLITKLQTVKVPRCSIYRDGQWYPYAQVIEYAFGLCSLGSTTAAPSASGSGSGPETTSAFDSATAGTPSPTTATDTTSASSPKKSTSHVGLIAGGVVAAVVCIAIAAFVAYKCGQRRRQAAAAKRASDAHDVVEAQPLSPLDGTATSSAAPFTAVAMTPTTVSSPGKRVSDAHNAQSTQLTAVSTDGSAGSHHKLGRDVAMWDDPVITAVRIPHDTIFFGPLISRGGFGEVFKGTYKGVTVAIKQLLPERRKDLAQIDAFLGEIKLMSTLDHERIVRFVGVAWNSLSDACAVVEYMERGDLRSVLNKWGTDSLRLQGFDADKVKIALHIAHALTYLHSLQPVVVHRDLKSKNILLGANYDAKLTDFGVSRERADSTMTAGVGSSLWMAPEVMMGERYDEKADIFSFGVVLSELDTHKLPYFNATEAGSDRKIPDSAILQLVSLGRLEVTFTSLADSILVRLGRECVSLDPTKRPTAAEVLHRVHQVLRGGSM